MLVLVRFCDRWTFVIRFLAVPHACVRVYGWVWVFTTPLCVWYPQPYDIYVRIVAIAIDVRIRMKRRRRVRIERSIDIVTSKNWMFATAPCISPVRFSNFQATRRAEHINKREWHWAVFKGCFRLYSVWLYCDVVQSMCVMMMFKRIILITKQRSRFVAIFLYN